MRTIAPGRLCYEDIAFNAIQALRIHWPSGHSTVYRGEGRPDNMLFYTVSGARHYQEEGDWPGFDIQAGDLMIMPAGSRYQNIVTSEGGSAGICLQFSMRDAAGIPCRLGDHLALIARDEDGHIRLLLNELLVFSLQKGSVMHVKELLMRLLQDIYHQAVAEGADAELYPAIRYMEKHLQAPVPVARMAALCHMSESTFARRFRDLTGMAPSRYHRRLRLDKSRELLESGLYTVDQTASALGFYDAAHFSRCFHACFGVSAGSVRRGT